MRPVIYARVAYWASVALYCLQLAFYTAKVEQVVYASYGAAWFLCLFRLGRHSIGRLDVLLFAALAALSLGLVPHRLRIATQEFSGGEYSDGSGMIYLIIIPLIHFFLTSYYLYGGPYARNRDSR